MLGSHDNLLTPPSATQPCCLPPSPGGWRAASSSTPTTCSPSSAPSPPTMSPWRASCCSERSRAPSHRHFSGHRSRSLTTSAYGSPAKPELPASLAQIPGSRLTPSAPATRQAIVLDGLTIWPSCYPPRQARTAWPSPAAPRRAPSIGPERSATVTNGRCRWPLSWTSSPLQAV